MPLGQSRELLHLSRQNVVRQQAATGREPHPGATQETHVECRVVRRRLELLERLADGFEAASLAQIDDGHRPLGRSELQETGLGRQRVQPGCLQVEPEKLTTIGQLGNRPAGLEPGQFVSPHGLAVDSRGDIYVGEVSFTNWGRRGPLPPGLRSLQKLVKVR